MVAVAEFEGSSQDADCIVVRLLAPRLAVCNRNQLGVTDLMKELPAECRAPYTVQDSSIGADCRRGQVMPRQSSLTVRAAQIGFSDGGRWIEGRYLTPSNVKSNWILPWGAATTPPANHLLPICFAPE
jgi:hypothetical protein